MLERKIYSGSESIMYQNHLKRLESTGSIDICMQMAAAFTHGEFIDPTEHLFISLEDELPFARMVAGKANQSVSLNPVSSLIVDSRKIKSFSFDSMWVGMYTSVKRNSNGHMFGIRTDGNGVYYVTGIDEENQIVQISGDELSREIFRRHIYTEIPVDFYLFKNR